MIKNPSFLADDIHQLSRLPFEFAKRSLEGNAGRTLLDSLLKNGLSSLPLKEQGEMLDIFQIHSNILLRDDQAVDTLLVQFVEECCRCGSMGHLSTVESILKKWLDVIIHRSATMPSESATPSPPSHLAALFSSNFCRDNSQNSTDSNRIAEIKRAISLIENKYFSKAESPCSEIDGSSSQDGKGDLLETLSLKRYAPDSESQVQSTQKRRKSSAQSNQNQTNMEISELRLDGYTPDNNNEMMQNVGVLKQHLNILELKVTSLTTQQICNHIDQVFEKVCAPLLGASSKKLRMNWFYAALFYSMAMKEMRVLEQDIVTDDMFISLTEELLSPQHVGSMQHYFGTSEGSSPAFISFFLSLAVQARIRNQLKASPASRKVARVVETCCKLHPLETIHFVLMPCTLPPAAILSSLSSSSNPSPISPSKHLYELVNRIIRQGTMSTLHMNELLRAIFSPPYPQGVQIPLSDILLRGSIVEHAESQIMCSFLGAVSSSIESKCLKDMKALQGNAIDLNVLNAKFTSSSSEVLSMNVFPLHLSDMNCLKFFTTALMALFSKQIIDTTTTQTLVQRFDEATAAHSEVANSPLTANLMHALVVANRNSKGQLLSESREEVLSILSRCTKKSIVARNALTEFKKQI